ncbi:hypothetical protein, partial [Staphylococcus epidermidis]|uniref:hypothetical protein n=1 Tax=Staphylococcus epidermidis TaxID=1282 RepID=UPI0028CB8F0C
KKIKIKKKKQQIKPLNQPTTQFQHKLNQQLPQPLPQHISFLTTFINKHPLNQKILNQQYDLLPSLISHLYQTQTTINNTYLLTFSHQV